MCLDPSHHGSRLTAATCSNAFARVGRWLLPFRIMPNILAKPLKTTAILLIPPFSEAPQHFRNYHICYFIVLFTCFHVSSSWVCKVPELGLDWDLITPWDSRAVTLSLWVYCFCPLSVYWSSVFLWNWLLKKAECLWIFFEISGCNSIGSKIELMMEGCKMLCIWKASVLGDSIPNTNPQVRWCTPDPGLPCEMLSKVCALQKASKKLHPTIQSTSGQPTINPSKCLWWSLALLDGICIYKDNNFIITSLNQA